MDMKPWGPGGGGPGSLEPERREHTGDPFGCGSRGHNPETETGPLHEMSPG